MSIIRVHDAGGLGFDRMPVAGTAVSDAAPAGGGLSDRDQLVADVEQAGKLADVLRAAIADARKNGLTAFSPSQMATGLAAALAPQVLSDALRANEPLERLFTQVMECSYGGRSRSLEEWSAALEKLQHWVGANASRLPPALGGGIRGVQGVWYVNGEPFSTSELFTANRVNRLGELDTLVAASLNGIAANNETVKDLSALMQTLFAKYNQNDWISNVTTAGGLSILNWTISYPSQQQEFPVNKNWVDFAGHYKAVGDDLTKGNVGAWGYSQAGSPFVPAERRIYFQQLLAYANKFLGPDSLIAKLNTLGTAFSDGFGKEDFRAMIDEVQKIIDSLASDNQVAAQRNETLFNSRTNVLEGLSSVLKGQQTLRSTVSRNL